MSEEEGRRGRGLVMRICGMSLSPTLQSHLPWGVEHGKNADEGHGLAAVLGHSYRYGLVPGLGKLEIGVGDDVADLLGLRRAKRIAKGVGKMGENYKGSCGGVGGLYGSTSVCDFRC